MMILPLSSQIAPKMSGSRPRNIEQPVQIVEVDAKLQVVLDDILDRDRRLYIDAPGVSVLRKQSLRIAFDGVVWHIGNPKSHARFIRICIVGRPALPRRLFFPRLLCLPRQCRDRLGRQPLLFPRLLCQPRHCRDLLLLFPASRASRASAAIASAVTPFAARRKSAISRGRSRMMSVRSDATRPASASSSSASCPMIPAIFLTLSSAGGGNSSRSTFD